MNRVEMVERIAERHQVTKAEANRILSTVFDSIVTSVKKGEPFAIVGFGTFRKVARAARQGFNPHAGKVMKIAAKQIPKFTPGQKFKDAVDPKTAKRRAAK